MVHTTDLTIEPEPNWRSMYEELKNSYDALAVYSKHQDVRIAAVWKLAGQWKEAAAMYYDMREKFRELEIQLVARDAYIDELEDEIKVMGERD
jgi:hypothetical protein